MNTVCDPVVRVKGNGAANGSNGNSHQESETKYLSRWRAMEMDTMRSMNHSLLAMNKSNVMPSLHPGFMIKYHDCPKKYWTTIQHPKWHISVWRLREGQDHWQHDRLWDRGQPPGDKLSRHQSGRNQVSRAFRENSNVFFLFPLWLNEVLVYNLFNSNSRKQGILKIYF